MVDEHAERVCRPLMEAWVEFEQDRATLLDLRPPLPLMIEYIERYKNLFGVGPIAATLTSANVPIAPSTF